MGIINENALFPDHYQGSNEKKAKFIFRKLSLISGTFIFVNI
jgi:hypothetical protein